MKTEKRKTGGVRPLALLLLVPLLFLTLTSCGKFSYTESDLSGYLTLSREDYMGLTLTVAIDPVSDMKVEERILKLRYQYRNSTPECQSQKSDRDGGRRAFDLLSGIFRR